METVQLQCGHCQKLMAVGVAHLGKQVQCPHCHQVVQVPQASTMSEAPPRAEENLPKLRISTHDDESILASNSDDLFADRPPRLELPPANEPNVAVREKEQAGKTDAALPGTEDNEELPLPTIPRRREEKSMVVPIMFMFLIPYALATTAFIAFLLYNQGRNRFDPLERLPDPKPNEGGPRQIQHDLDVKLKTSLQQTVRIGDLEVTPLKVQQTSEGDLTLHMKMRNA
jgi:phage FluMu protein Com